MRLINRHMIVLALAIVFFYKATLAQAQTASSTFTVYVTDPGASVAPICRGQQIEEFNHQFEGGLYAQLINNPSFEEIDRNLNSTPVVNWSLIRQGSSDGTISGQTSGETSMLNSHQNHCIKLAVTSVASGSVGIANGGYWGIKLVNDTKYRVSFWAKGGSDFKGTLRANLESNDGKVYAHSADFKIDGKWKHFTCELTTSGISDVTGTNRFVIYASAAGVVYLDVVTVMPPTWKDRPNGLRPDLAERLDALKLKYIQFPGGCTAESYKMSECWNWKNSIGPLEQRAGSTRNRWWYNNELYFGLDEYLQLCEDIGAEPVYTTSAGISEPHLSDGQWYGICPLDKMMPIVNDILDLIQYCNGSISTHWGAKRAENGHRAPYNLKYIEIGNESVFSYSRDGKIYSDRYKLIRDAIKAVAPDMQIMYNGNPSEAHSNTLGNSVDFTDEHFYRKDLSILSTKYDSIDPTLKKICVAEFANNSRENAQIETGNFEDALGDAAFMIGCERNSERMWWTGYGNYAGFAGHFDFGPCIVWNDAVSNYVTPSYHMIKMLFADNSGTRILPFIHNTVNCFWSASIDTESGKNDVLLKVVNNKDKPETVDITLKGSGNVNPVGHFTVLTGAPDAENSLTDPDNVAPVLGTFVAGKSFNYLFPAWSVTVLRIGIMSQKSK